jgi:ABC-type dipeptide/oligopeptide/nickel transport system permease subunit
VRAQVISLRNRDHVNLSKLSGHSLAHIITNDTLPYIASYVIMELILQISGAILAEAGLSILGLAYYVSDTVYIMERGKFVEWGSADAVILTPREPYTQRLISDVPKIYEEWDLSTV